MFAKRAINSSTVYLPTLGEIAVMCAEIEAGWSPAGFHRRFAADGVDGAERDRGSVLAANLHRMAMITG